MNVPTELAELVVQALNDALSAGALPKADVDSPVIERPQNLDHGDYACSLPLKLARPMKMNPMEIAEAIASRVGSQVWLEKVRTAPPGSRLCAMSACGWRDCSSGRALPA